jgi:hypothetical protein
MALRRVVNDLLPNIHFADGVARETADIGA